VEYLIVFVVGIISSITGALLGIGGGIIIVPSLAIILKLPMQNAIAVSLATIVSTSILVTAENIKKNMINFDMGLSLELSTSIFAILASLIAIKIEQNILKAAFGFFLLFIAVFMYKKPKKADVSLSSDSQFSYFDAKLNKTIFYNVEHPYIAVAISSFAGFLSGLLGIGGGVVKVPILNGICKIPMKVASSTSALMVGITAAAASLVYYRHGYILPNLVFFTSLGAVFGSKAGLYIAKKSKNETIEKIFVAVLILTALEMIIKALK
jgi:uncharacterized membrane protein YfcA